jgi:endonuclease-3
MDLRRVETIFARLVAIAGEPQLAPTGDPLGELIGTILSQSTSDVNSDRAFLDLRAAFPSWESVHDADPSALAAVIHHGGLARIKATRIQAALRALTAVLPPELRALGLADGCTRWLQAMSVPQALDALQQLPGVGPKTAACVLLFALGRPAMPVDTHVFRVSQRLGLLPPGTSAARAHEIYDAALPAAMVYPLHILFIRHGRTLCRAQRPHCTLCPLIDLCPWGQTYIAAPHGSPS